MLEEDAGEGQASRRSDQERREAKRDRGNGKQRQRTSDKATGQAQADPKGLPVARVMFRRLRVREDSTVRYSREAFEHWIDEDSNGCDTRREVLRRSNQANGDGGRCGAEWGRWFSVYDGKVTNDPSEFEIDHLIPLAEAWRSGADEWPDVKRMAFANDLHPYSLIAVSSESNREKGDKDPSQWLPPKKDFRCQYIARWIAVKFRWRLSIDPAEHRALDSALKSCDNPSLRLNLKIIPAS